jgi:glycosyltransferase involved in cell wall biosynthesis
MIFKKKLFFIKKKTENLIDYFFGKKLVLEKISIEKKFSKAIFIFGITDFYYRIQRWQHLSRIFSKKLPTFYIEPTFLSFKKIINYHPDQDFGKFLNRENNLFITQLISERNYFIYQEEPSKKSKKIISQSLNNLLKKFGIKNFVFIITHPFWHFLTDYFDNEKIIYDCLDDHQGFVENRKDIESLEKKLVEKSKFVVVTSENLMKSFFDKKKVFLISNGVDKKLINKKNIFFKKEKKLLGYIGEINWWMDVHLVETILKSFPDYEFIFVGMVNNTKIKKLAIRFKNLRLTGEVKYKEIRQYLKKFDIALIPFTINDFTNKINPVKVYEFFAFGLPVVATSIFELQKIPQKLIYLSSSKKDFILNIKKALMEKNVKLSKERINFALKNTWDKKASQYFDLIKNII